MQSTDFELLFFGCLLLNLLYYKSMIEEYTQAQSVLTQAYNFFNERFAEGELKDALITVQSVGRKRAYGWFAGQSWMDKDGKAFHEINIGAEHFKRSNEDILETLLHEMAHLWNYQNGIDDCTATQYHKKTFADAAKRFGLKCEMMGRFGYAKTSLDDASNNAIKELELGESVFNIFRSPRGRGAAKEKKYLTLNVGIEYQDRLDEVVAKMSAKNRREALENLIEDYLSNY